MTRKYEPRRGLDVDDLFAQINRAVERIEMRTPEEKREIMLQTMYEQARVSKHHHDSVVLGGGMSISYVSPPYVKCR